MRIADARAPAEAIAHERCTKAYSLARPHAQFESLSVLKKQVAELFEVSKMNESETGREGTDGGRNRDGMG